MNKLSRLRQYLRPYNKNLLVSVFFHVLAAIFTVVSIPLIIPFFQILFNTEPETINAPTSTFDVEAQLKFYFNQLVINYEKQQALLIVCSTIILVFFLKNLSRYLASYFIIPARNGIVADIRKKLFQKYLSLPLSFFTEEKKGNLISKLSADVQEIEASIINVLEASFKAPFIMLGSLFFMIYLSPQLSIFVAVLLVFVVVVIGGISRRLRKQSSEAQNKLSEIISQTEESLGGIKVIKAFQAQDLLNQSFFTKNDQLKNILTKILRRRDLSSPFSEFLGVSVVAVLLYYGSSLVFADQLSPGSFFAFIFAFYQVIEPSKTLANAYYNVQKGLASVDRIEEVFAERNELVESQGSGIFNSLQKGIQFRDVSFQYKNNTELVLNSINCFFPVGKTTALVGLSGAGKTTMVDLIARFYDPSNGTILIDDQSLPSFELESIRSAFGMVTQEAFLFNDTIENNILFGSKNKSKEDIIQASKLAHAHDFIMNIDGNYQSKIGDRGVKLSGGQRQRITLARAILKNPSIFIFDEATSALDAESEKLIQKAMDLFLAGRTAIVIAHRLSTIYNADQIIVMKEGQIVEIGTHTELIENNGEYQKFVKLQEINQSNK